MLQLSLPHLEQCFEIQCLCMCWHCWFHNQAGLWLCSWIIHQWKQSSWSCGDSSAACCQVPCCTSCIVRPVTLGAHCACDIPCWAALGLSCSFMRLIVTKCKCWLAVQRKCLALHQQESARVMEHNRMTCATLNVAICLQPQSHWKRLTVTSLLQTRNSGRW